MRRLLIVLTLFGLVNFPDALLLLRAHDLGLSTARVIIAYIAVYAVGAYPAGALSDRLPRHLIFALGLVFFAAGYLGLGLVHASWLVFVLLPLYGGFAACTDGVGKAWVSSLAPGSGQGSAPGSLPGAERRRCAGRWVVGRSAVARVRDRAVAWRWHCGRGLGAGAAARRPPAGPDCTLSRGRCRTRTGPHLARPGRLLGVWDAPREPTAKRMQRLRMPDRQRLRIRDRWPAQRPGAQERRESVPSERRSSPATRGWSRRRRCRRGDRAKGRSGPRRHLPKQRAGRRCCSTPRPSMTRAPGPLVPAMAGAVPACAARNSTSPSVVTAAPARVARSRQRRFNAGGRCRRTPGGHDQGLHHGERQRRACTPGRSRSPASGRPQRWQRRWLSRPRCP